MKASQLRELRKDELADKLDELEKQLFDLRAQGVTEKLENTCAKMNVKRDIARIKTIIRANEIKDH